MNPDRRRLLRNFLIELLVYGGLVFAYFLTVLRFLGEWLTSLFAENLPLYAIAALVLIVAQGVVLESLTSLLVRLLGLERLE